MTRFTVDGRGRLVFYGNMVGYVKDSTAVVDEMFQSDELCQYLSRLELTPQWEDGVYDRLTGGEAPVMSLNCGSPGKAAVSGSSNRVSMWRCASSAMRTR